MLSRPLARLAAPSLALFTHLLNSAPADAGSPYSGWRGQYGTPYTAYKAGADFDDNRRPLDGSLRDAPLTNPGNWTGLYAGAHLGAGMGDIETSDLASASIDADTFLGGIHAGYNLQMGNFVGGLEVDGTWGNGGDSVKQGSLDINAGSDWMSSARLRLGYASGNWLVYATGGVALGDIDVALKDTGIDDQMSQTMVGYAIGGGVELKLTDSWVARVEALHYGFSEEEFKSAPGTIGIEADVTTVRAGLSMRFN